MRILKPLVLALFGLLASVGLAQIPAPQINLSGNIGCQGFPCFNVGTLVFSVDANHSMTAQESSAQSPSLMKVTSSVSLTATRNLIAPAGRFSFTIENATTGGQSIQIIGPSGTGVTIANGTTVSVGNDGVNYVQVGASGGSSISLTTTGTSGAASLSGSVLNVPQYQAGLTLTTTGSSGPATLSGGTLNIPQYSGGTCAIGTCILNAGTASQTITESVGFGLGYIGTSWGINPVFNNAADFSETFGHFIVDPTDMGGANGGKGAGLHRPTITFDNPGYDWGYSVNGSTQWFTGIGEIYTTNFNAAGIGSALAPTVNHPSVGDSIGIALIDQVNGGYQALSDEGAVGNRIVVQEGSSSAGLVVSGGTTGSQSMVVNVTQPLGVGRIIYDQTATTGVIATTQTLGSATAGIQTVNLGTTVAQSTCGVLAGGPIVATTAYSITSNVITINGTNSLYQNENITLSGYGTSTFLNGQSVFVIASTGTAFTAAFTHANVSLTTEAGAFNTVNVDTPRQANNGSISMTFGITLGSAYVGSTTALITMGGTGFIDTSQLSAVGSYTGGVQYVTAPLIHPILSGATVCMGGLAGYGELNTTSPFGGYINFILGSPTTTSALTTAIPAGRPSSGYAKAGSVTLYPIAIIQSIVPGSTPTVAVTPNVVAWVNGDTISIPNGITAQYSTAENEITNRNPYAQYSGVGSAYTGPATFLGGALFTANASETASTLTSQGGLGFAPTVMDIIGHAGAGMYFRQRPSDCFISGNACPNSLMNVNGCTGGFTCATTYYIHSDGTFANPSAGILFTPGSSTSTYNFTGSVPALIQQNGTAVCLQSGTNCPTPVSSLAFSAITSGTNTTGLVVGSGGVLSFSGTGLINANELNAVPFCTGFTPTNAQFLQYTTASSPNPCYTAASASGSGNTTSTGLTTGFVPKANGANSIINSAIDDGATTANTVTISETLNLTNTACPTCPGATSWIAGSGGSLAALAANSFGFAAPVTGGTSYLIKAPATITAGIAHFAAPATADGVNESALTSSAVNLATSDVTGLLPHANIASTAVTPGSYTSANITVAADGSITAAANGSGSGATFPGTNNIVFNTSTTASRNATSADVIALWTGSCSSSTFLRGDGACAGPAGSGTVTTSGSPTTGFFSLFTGATVIGNSHLDDGVTTSVTLTSTENVAAPSFLASTSVNSPAFTVPAAGTATNVANFGSVGPYQSSGSYWTGSVAATENAQLNVTAGTGSNPTFTMALSFAGSSGFTAFSAPNLIASSLGNSTSPVCPNGTNNALTTVGCAAGSGVTSVTGVTNQTTSSGGTTPAIGLSSTIVFPGTISSATAGAASTPMAVFSGAPFAGTGTTSFPLMDFNTVGTARTTLNTGGTYIGIDANSGFAGNFQEFRVNNGNPVFTVGSTGTIGSGAWGNNSATASITATGRGTFTTIFTLTQCSSTASPAVCVAAASGTVQLAAAATTLQVNTTAITATSVIGCLTYNTVGITAPTNLASLITPSISAITAGTSFTLTFPVAPLTNPVNIGYCIIH